MQKLLLAALVALAFPALARAGDVAMVSRDVQLGPRALQAAAPPMRFNLLGVHWRGTGHVLFRTRSLAGRWSRWTEADDDTRASRSWRQGGLVWTGGSDRVQFRTRGRVARVRAFYLWSRVEGEPKRALSIAGSPAITPRAGWFADEKIKRAKPSYAPALRLAVVHHTAGSNNYSPAQAAAIVRGIEIYHVKGNGWNDIGYNFLVDRYGTVYEGRAGGVDRNVIGAHAEGFNTGTVGVALIGNYSTAQPPAAQRAALVKLLAWRLDIAHVDPKSTVVYTSGGNAKYRAGRTVTLRAISGHRDTGPSECPGSATYRLLPSIVSQVAATGLPKLYSPVASGVLGGSVRFQARLSSSMPWTVTVTDALGVTVAQGKGTGAIVDWTWDSRTAVKGSYRWTIAGNASTLPATGTLGFARPTPLLSALKATPTVITPNADGSGDSSRIEFTLGASALVSVQVQDLSGAPLLFLETMQRLPGPNAVDWGARVLPDGRYRLVVTAKPVAGAAVTQSLDMVVDRTLAGFTTTPPFISPNGDGIFDTTTFSFMLAQNVPVRLEIRTKTGAVVATAWNAPLGIGPHVLDWNGLANGMRVADGLYDAVVTVTDQLGDVSLSLPLTVDTTPPVLTLLDARTLRFQLNEPATVTLLVNNQRLQRVQPSGVFTIPWTGAVATVSGVAQDAAGNVSPQVKSP